MASWQVSTAASVGTVERVGRSGAAPRVTNHQVRRREAPGTDTLAHYLQGRRLASNGQLTISSDRRTSIVTEPPAFVGLLPTGNSVNT